MADEDASAHIAGAAAAGGERARRALVLTGPTGVGKTGLSLRVAEALDGEIISADSRQVYTGLDIGTAKATAGERARVPHHGLDRVEPTERYSAGRFAQEALRLIDEIRGRGRVPIVVGGTGFFIRALTHPMFTEPPMNRDRRERLEAFLNEVDPDTLREWLRRLDPESAAALRSRGGLQRTLRALEVVLLTGRPLPWWQRHSPPRDASIRGPIFVLDRPREELYARIDRRVSAMLEAGLAQEVAEQLEAGYPPDAPGLSATGYPEIMHHLWEGLPLEEAAERIRRKTRAYARRQLTWFRHKLPERARWLDASRPEEELVGEVVEAWRRS